MLSGWLIGSAIGVWMLDGANHLPGETDVGCAGFGLLIGWVVGTIHGFIVLTARRNEQADPNDDLTTQNTP